jgi:hypothetical protein
LIAQSQFSAALRLCVSSYIGASNRRVALEAARYPASRLLLRNLFKSTRGHIYNINPHNELPAIFGAYHFVPQNRWKNQWFSASLGFKYL